MHGKSSIPGCTAFITVRVARQASATASPPQRLSGEAWVLVNYPMVLFLRGGVHGGVRQLHRWSGSLSPYCGVRLSHWSSKNPARSSNRPVHGHRLHFATRQQIFPHFCTNSKTRSFKVLCIIIIGEGRERGRKSWVQEWSWDSFPGKWDKPARKWNPFMG